MLNKIIATFFLLIMTLATQAATPSDARQLSAQNTFAIMDGFFVRRYSSNNNAIGKATRPLLIINGFNYQLYFPDGRRINYNGLLKPFNALKAVSHIGPALYAIGSPAWSHTKSYNWQRVMRQYRVRVENALNVVNDVDWANAAWPGKEKKLQAFMQSSLKMALSFIDKTLKQDHYTQQDYQRFATRYMHTMVATMYLADVANTTATLKQLKLWKKQLGTHWQNLYVVVMGSKGRTTAGLTLNTNTAAYTVASLMSPQQVKTHILITPAAKNLQQTLTILGTVINARQLAKATFTNKTTRHMSGLYAALKKPTVPLAMQNVKRIIAQYLRSGQVKLPEMKIADWPK